MRTVPMFASPAVYTRRSALAAQLRRKYLVTRQISSRDLAVQRHEHHPCWKSAHFLQTRPPDVMKFIDEGNALTLEEVLNIGLKYSRDSPSIAMSSLLCELLMLSAPVLAPSAVRVATHLTLRLALQATQAAVMEAPAPGIAPFAWFMTMSTGTSSGLMKSTTPTLLFLKSTALARIRFFSNARSMTFLTKTPVMPSLPLLPGSPSRSTSALTLTLMPLVNVSCCAGECTRTSSTEGCLFGGLSICLVCYISILDY